MNIESLRENKINCWKESKDLVNSNKEAKGLNKENDFSCFIYEEKSAFINEENLFKEKETNDFLPSEGYKNSVDLNLKGKNLHEFLNNDLIKALDNDLTDQKDISDFSDCNSSNEYIEVSSECTSKANSPEFNIKCPKIIKDINMNLNVENSTIINDTNIMNTNYSLNKDILINQIKNINNNTNENGQAKDEEEEKTIDINIKDKINILNNSIFSPILISKTINKEKDEIKSNKEKENYFGNNNSKEKKSNLLKNKFDDDVEPIIMVSLVNREEKPKFPLEIRAGDWICIYCNNLNFSFRIKCNRCGLLRKSTTRLLNHKYFNNKYMHMRNFNSYNGGYDMNYNQNNNNYDITNYYYNNKNL